MFSYRTVPVTMVRWWDAGSPVPVREDFHDGKETHDVACMVIIRFAALLERPEFEPRMEAVTQQERLAIRTTRNIAARTGYRSMNDDLFWLAVTQRAPAILDRLRGW